MLDVLLLHVFSVVATAVVGFIAFVRIRRRLARASAITSRHLHVAFLHPDLGIGGAERLVVDAAVALQRRGHAVSITTAHHDTSRCFTETRDGTLRVRIAGSGVPRHFLGRLHIVCATVRSVLGAVSLLISEPKCDVIFVDAVPASVPLLRACGVPVLFYCHFPDKLLAPVTGNTVRRLARHVYRLPFNILEELCTGMATRVLVNSAYTASVYADNFHILRAARLLKVISALPSVLHPSIDLERNQALPWASGSQSGCSSPQRAHQITLVSINRFERKKALELAIHALHELREHASSDVQDAARHVCLVLAGGWDARLRENVEYHQELEALVCRYAMEGVVQFRRNVTDEERCLLLETCAAVVYTPSFEHFGIVPIEAMAAARPVIAVALGGPCESVAHGQTGWLCEPTPAAFAAAFEELLRLEACGALESRGCAARSHVEQHFGLNIFGARLDTHLRKICT